MSSILDRSWMWNINREFLINNFAFTRRLYSKKNYRKLAFFIHLLRYAFNKIKRIPQYKSNKVMALLEKRSSSELQIMNKKVRKKRINFIGA